MDKDEVKEKNNAIIHKNTSLNRLDLSFLKHIELSEYKKSKLINKLSSFLHTKKESC